jgi:ribonucleases P/MRP protein subunit RPP40
LQRYVEASSLLDSSQFGFRRNKNCELQLLLYTNFLCKHVDVKDTVHAVYLDLQKAFDKVPHPELLYKVQYHFGVCGVVLQWLSAFLSGRRQRVIVGSASSNWEGVSSGVPQGSVLAPLLFILYVHDMQAGLEGAELLKFADDTKLFSVIRNDRDCVTMQKNLDLLSLWSRTWKMPVNASKSAVISFGRKRDVGGVYIFTGENLTVSHREKDLGIIISSSLSYKPHILAVTAKALKIYGWMARNLVSRDPQVILKIYKTLVRPLLEYASTVWSPTRVGLINILEKVQRKLTKLVGRSYGSYSDRLKALHLPSLRWRRNYLDMLKVHQILHGDEGIRKCFFTLNSEVSGRNLRRHRLTIHKGVVHCDVYKRHFANRVVDSWNSLPEHLLNISAFNLFKRKLKAYLHCRGDAYT